MILKEIQSREELDICLILVPSSLTYKWKNEMMLRFGEDYEIYGTKEFISLIDSYDNYHASKHFHKKIIINYHTLRNEKVVEKLDETLLEINFLIADEAHNFRNRGTATFQAGQLITSISDNILFLTATPVQNRLEDLYNILSLLNDDYFLDFETFCQRLIPNRVLHSIKSSLRNTDSKSEILDLYSSEDVNNFPEQLKNIIIEIKKSELSNEQRIDFIDKLNSIDFLNQFISRTKKRDVGRLLPRNVRTLRIKISEKEENYYQSVIQFVLQLHTDAPRGFITIMPERMVSSSMIASVESFKAMKDEGNYTMVDSLTDDNVYLEFDNEAKLLLDNVISQGEKLGDEDSKFKQFIESIEQLQGQGLMQVIVFSFFKFTLRYLHRKLTQLNYRTGIIHGDINVEERYSTIKKFEESEFDILLSSEVGSEGLDMQFCNVIINYDLPWNPMRVEQRIGRIDRMGQKFEKLHVVNLCIYDSIEDRIVLRLYEKLFVFQGSIGEAEPVLGNFVGELEFEKLLSLSKEELEEVLQLKELAAIRRQKEVSNNHRELDGLLSDEYDEIKQASNKAVIKSTYLNKIGFRIVKQFCEKNNLRFKSEKDCLICIHNSSRQDFIRLLRHNTVNRREKPNQYILERSLIQKIVKAKDGVTLSFISELSSQYEYLHIGLNSPLYNLIKSQNLKRNTLLNLTSDKYNDGTGIVVRLEINALRQKSLLKIMIKSEDKISTHDYLEFISTCKPTTQKNSNFNNTELDSIKAKVNSYIESYKHKEKEYVSRVIKTKKDSLVKHYDRKILKVQEVIHKLDNFNVIKMKRQELENLKTKKRDRINEVDKSNKVSVGYEILGYIKLFSNG